MKTQFRGIQMRISEEYMGYIWWILAIYTVGSIICFRASLASNVTFQTPGWKYNGCSQISIRFIRCSGRISTATSPMIYSGKCLTFTVKFTGANFPNPTVYVSLLSPGHQKTLLGLVTQIPYTKYASAELPITTKEPYQIELEFNRTELYTTAVIYFFSIQNETCYQDTATTTTTRLTTTTTTITMSDSSSCWNNFDCTNGQCIESAYVCDGYNDCRNGLDEKGCGGSIPIASIIIPILLVFLLFIVCCIRQARIRMKTQSLANRIPDVQSTGMWRDQQQPRQAGIGNTRSRARTATDPFQHTHNNLPNVQPQTPDSPDSPDPTGWLPPSYHDVVDGPVTNADSGTGGGVDVGLPGGDSNAGLPGGGNDPGLPGYDQVIQGDFVELNPAVLSQGNQERIPSTTNTDTVIHNSYI